MTEAIALTWNFSRRLKVSADVFAKFQRDIDQRSVNTLASSLDASYSMNSKTSLTSGVGGGYNRFNRCSGGGTAGHLFHLECRRSLHHQ